MSTYITGYNTYMATTQVSRMVGMMGAYYKWKPTKTFLISALASGAISGFLNPAGVLGDQTAISAMGMGKGALVGSLGSLASAGVVLAIDGDKIKEGKSPGIGAQLAGMATGIAVGEFARNLVIHKPKESQFKPIKGIEKGTETFQRVGGKEKPTMRDFDNTTFSHKIAKATGEKPSFRRAISKMQSDGTTFIDKIGDEYLFKLDTGETVLLSQQEMNLGRYTRFHSDGTIFMPTDGKLIPAGADKNLFMLSEAKLTSGETLSRLTIGPLLEVRKQLPMLASSALAMAVTSGIKDKYSEYKPLVSSIISFAATPLFGAADTMFSPDYSLWANAEVKLGYVPELKIRRDDLIKQASNIKLYKEIEAACRKLSEEARDSSKTFVSRQELIAKLEEKIKAEQPSKYASSKLKIVDHLTDEELITLATSEGLTVRDFASLDELQVALKNNGVKNVDKLSEEKIYSLAKNKNILSEPVKVFTPEELIPESLSQNLSINSAKVAEQLDTRYKQSRIKDIDTMRDNIRESIIEAGDRRTYYDFINKPGDMPDRLKAFEKIGGTRFDVFGIAFQKALTHDLPVGVISGLTQMGMNSVLKDSNPQKAMLVSLAGTVAASVGRATVLYLDYKWGVLEDWDPANTTSHAFALKRAGEGSLSPADQTKYTATERAIIENVEKESQREWTSAETEKKLQLIKSALKKLGGDIDINRPIAQIITEANGIIEVKSEEASRQTNWFDRFIMVPIRQLRLKPKIEEARVALRPFQNSDDGTRTVTEVWRNLVKLDEAPSTASFSATKVPEDMAWIGHRVFLQYLDVKNRPIGKPFTPEVGKKIDEDIRYELTKDGQFSPRIIKTLYDGKRSRKLYAPEEIPLSTIIINNIGQGLFEFGWQTLAMGLPHTKGGEMSTYGWYRYQQNLQSLAGYASQKGFWQGMQMHSADVGKGLIDSRVLLTLSNIKPLNTWLGLSRFVPITGYKGMPYSEAAIIETGLGESKTLFMPTNPYYSLRPIPSESLSRYLRGTYYNQPHDIQALGIEEVEMPKKLDINKIEH
jgi:hypothetical protein